MLGVFIKQQMNHKYLHLYLIFQLCFFQLCFNYVKYNLNFTIKYRNLNFSNKIIPK